MYEFLFSGLYDVVNKFNHFEIMSGKAFSVPTTYIDYYDPVMFYSCRFFYYLRFLCSKESFFRSTFLGSNKVLEEFASKYGNLIDYWWNREELKSLREKNKLRNNKEWSLDSETKLELLLDDAIRSRGFNVNDCHLNAQNALDWIFFKAFEQKFMSNNYNYDEFLKQLLIAYNSSIIFLDRNGKNYRPSSVREGYMYLIQHLIKKHGNIKMTNDTNYIGESHRKRK